jgi:hypothetical protein
MSGVVSAPRLVVDPAMVAAAERDVVRVLLQMAGIDYRPMTVLARRASSTVTAAVDRALHSPPM